MVVSSLSLSLSHTHTHTLSLFLSLQCTHELNRIPVTDFDVFAGMEASVKTDHKNPMPTRYISLSLFLSFSFSLVERIL